MSRYYNYRNSDFRNRCCECSDSPCPPRPRPPFIGPTGPTGPQGPTGPVGIISGSVDSVEELPEIGSRGDMYLVNGVLYVWDETTSSWQSMGSLQGPTGATGPVGVITGSVDSVADLPEVGNRGDMYLVNGVLYVWDEVTGTWQSMGSLQGPTGATGSVGVITGTVDSIDDLPSPGNPGDMYLVNGVLYVWDEGTNSWQSMGSLQGPTGPAGSDATSCTIIPFASQVAPRTHISGGNPSQVSLLGFGYGDDRLQGTDLDDYAFPINASDRAFTLESYGNFQLTFSLPFDMTIRSIALTTGNYDDFTPVGAIYPYVQLYWAGPTSNTFMPLIEAFAEPELPIGSGFTPANTMRFALKEGLEINLEAGTRIAIGALARMTGDSTTQTYYLYYTGGIGMTHWIRED